MISGSKRFVFMHPSYKKKFEAHPNTKKNQFGWVDTDLDNNVPGYGAFFGHCQDKGASPKSFISSSSYPKKVRELRLTFYLSSEWGPVFPCKGRLDIDKMDLVKYPGWSTVDWSYADLAAGDCLYIPYQWYHQVTAAPVRSINVHIWYWRPSKMTEA
eukprot:6024657-Amphidinium_carterae.1